MILGVYYTASVMKSQVQSRLCYYQTMSEYTPPQDIAELVHAVNGRDSAISVVDAMACIEEKGYLFIGTAQTQAVHEPIPDQRYNDVNLGKDIYVEDPGVPVLQLTWSGRIAIMGAVFGDINVPNQRLLLGEPLTPEPSSYGWFGLWYEEVQASLGLPINDPEYLQYSIGIQADTRLLSAVRRRHDNIRGSADIVPHDESVYLLYGEQEPDEIRGITRPGILLSKQAKTTVASLHIYGSDLWETGIVAL
jgi:hypothetical protein